MYIAFYHKILGDTKYIVSPLSKGWGGTCPVQTLKLGPCLTKYFNLKVWLLSSLCESNRFCLWQ